MISFWKKREDVQDLVVRYKPTILVIHDTLCKGTTYVLEDFRYSSIEKKYTLSGVERSLYTLRDMLKT